MIEAPGAFSAPPPSRSPWQLLYGAAHALRWRWWAERARRLPRPVVSVGNLHWGGTGKTPLVAAVGGHLRDRGLSVAVLSRGYLSRGSGVRMVSHGEGPLLGPRVAGDEPVMLAGELPGVAVVVGPDRFEAGRHALERLDPPPDVFLLDDGFSHLRLFRDIDLVVFPSSDPYGGGRLFPGGRLREPLSSLARADGLVLTDAGDASASDFAGSLRPWGFSGPGFASQTRVLPARLSTGELLQTETAVLLVAAIARPGAFFAAARLAGYRVAGSLSFPDHHRYSRRSLERIEASRRNAGAGAVLTTTKDRVKLLGRLDSPLAELPVRAHPEPAFWDWLDRRLELQSAGLE